MEVDTYGSQAGVNALPNLRYGSLSSFSDLDRSCFLAVLEVVVGMTLVVSIIVRLEFLAGFEADSLA